MKRSFYAFAIIGLFTASSALANDRFIPIDRSDDSRYTHGPRHHPGHGYDDYYPGTGYDDYSGNNGCDLYFSDNNYNGIGSVEGTCWLDQKFTTAPNDSPSLRIIVRGLTDGERRVIFSQPRLRITNRPGYNRRPTFWDRNRNGKGTVVGSVNLYNVEDFRSRRVRVTAIIDGARFTLFQGYLPQY